MRRSLVRIAVVVSLVLVGVPTASADHIPVGDFQKGCGFTEEQWEDGVYDCGGSIPSIQDPGFVAAEEVDWLEDGDVVIGVASGGEAKAYPIKILNWHEVANDEVDGTPIAVTYCPLCGSSIVYERTVDDVVLDFHVSGYLFRQDLVMVDEQTHSLWPQIEGSAARGDLHGTSLTLFPSTTTGWSDWLEAHPDTLVLERPACGDNSTDNQRGCSGSLQRNYESYPYGGYQSDRSVGVTGSSRGDVQGLHPKDSVLGVTLNGTSKAYPLSTLSSEQVVNDEIGETPVVVTWFSSDGHAFVRPSEAPFELGEDNTTIVDPDGNRYDLITGESLDGGEELRELDGLDLFWFAWIDHNPDTELYTTNGTVQIEHEAPKGTPGPGILASLAAIAAVAALVASRRARAGPP